MRDLKRIHSEGSPYSKMVQLMRSTGYNRTMDVVLGTVLTPPPGITIKLDHLPIEIDKDDLLIAEHLAKHERIVSIEDDEINATDAKLRYEDPLKAGDRVIVMCMDEDPAGAYFVVIDRVIRY